MKNNYKPTESEEIEIWKELLIQEIGYSKAMNLYEEVLKHYNPITYAVQKAKNIFV